jgi:hypothetical protein
MLWTGLFEAGDRMWWTGIPGDAFVGRRMNAKERRRRLLRRGGAIALLVVAYPLFVVGFTWSHVLRSDFKGGKNGQLDAYRHALASATVSYTLGAWAVEVTTWAFESGGRESNEMDVHNNRIGALIGARAGAFSEIEPAVRDAVVGGCESAGADGQITWLPSSKWRDGKFW